MQREDLYELVRRIPVEDHPKTMLILRAGFVVTVEIYFRFEEDYVVIRGREAGTNDDARGFFIPYEEVVYLKIDRPLNVNEMRKMYGEAPLPEFEDRLSEDRSDEHAPLPAGDKSVSAAGPSAPMDPAEIARQNLLARIRAARTSAAATRSGRR
jgi:hypothetical protein